MADEREVPGEVDSAVPNIARVYDYWLGGKDNYAADRALAEKLIAIAGEDGPNPRSGARENRAFMGRAVRLAARGGIRQFLDIGTGLPAMGNVHQVAREIAPEARVAYVDYDPVVCAHGRAMLADEGRVRMIEADVRDARGVLAHPDVTDLVDFSEPVAVMLVAVLHYLSDSDGPDEVVGAFRERMAPGSLLVLSHISTDPLPARVPRGAAQFAASTARQTPRPRERIERFFTGLDVLDPGVVSVPLWRPGTIVPPHADRFPVLAGVGAKR
ncbi:SAM-dependent methyltransferase [Actinomadura roseirufa]|uniref:SAM-dependent methyltransferase n=1 Tax=Actinomadura roseirufa TaxID=2094049 RepID=UPI001040F471|nr:SAM-dependent methyltransferase [Actinomadura roseirufa]